jgi:hypothetical protein
MRLAARKSATCPHRNHWFAASDADPNAAQARTDGHVLRRTGVSVETPCCQQCLGYDSLATSITTSRCVVELWPCDTPQEQVELSVANRGCHHERPQIAPRRACGA